jgi:hypothetical protein
MLVPFFVALVVPRRLTLSIAPNVNDAPMTAFRREPMFT